jgi:uncharacterized membrane protein
MNDETSQPTSTGFSELTSEIACFVPILGVVPALAFLLMEKNKMVKWYALQSVLLWAFIVIADTFLQVSIIAAKLISPVNIIGLVIVPLVIALKINQKETVRLPLLAELADKFLSTLKV